VALVLTTNDHYLPQITIILTKTTT